MKVDIRPQWKKLAKWYWDTLEGNITGARGWSIWEMLEHDYGARKAFNIDAINSGRGMWVVFPDEKSYTVFVLKWS